MTESEQHSLQNDCDELLNQQKTLLLATLSTQGSADISYAPYLHEKGGFYIYVSELANHTQNLLTKSQASLMVIEPEADAANLFARKRLTLDCSVREISKADAEYERILQGFELKFGAIIAVLKSLPDFHLFCLQPNGGRFVAGFGKAIAVDALGALCEILPTALNSFERKDREA